jgi:hypothetical protein
MDPEARVGTVFEERLESLLETNTLYTTYAAQSEEERAKSLQWDRRKRCTTAIELREAVVAAMT